MSKSPQTGNGYTRIANELLEVKTRTRISGEENQIWEVIIRQTYGYNKKRDVIALSQFVSKTGMNKSAVCRAIKKLLDKNMIIKKDNASLVTYGIQKDYDRWKPLSKKITVIKKDNDNLVTLIFQKGCDKSKPLSKKTMSNNSVIKKDNQRYQKRDIQKTILQKKEILRDIKSRHEPSLLEKQKFLLRGKSSKKPTNPDIKKFIDWWFERFKKEVGEKYHVTGKDAKVVQGLLNTYSYEGLVKAGEYFWEHRDEFVDRAGHTMGVFSSIINKIIEKAKKEMRQ